MTVLTNAQSRPHVAALLGCAPADIVGFLVIVQTSDNMMHVRSNGNRDQVRHLIDRTLELPQMQQEGFTNDEVDPDVPTGGLAETADEEA